MNKRREELERVVRRFALDEGWPMRVIAAELRIHSAAVSRIVRRDRLESPRRRAGDDRGEPEGTR